MASNKADPINGNIIGSNITAMIINNAKQTPEMILNIGGFLGGWFRFFSDRDDHRINVFP